MSDLNGVPILVSGGAGYIGSHVVYQLKLAGFAPIVVDNLTNGRLQATRLASSFRQGDIADVDLIKKLCAVYKPVAALHFAAFIEVGESVSNPQKYFLNNRDNAAIFFATLAREGINKIVFSSTAAVYGEASVDVPITEEHSTVPINPYGQSKRDAEVFLQQIPAVKSIILRYFNVAGSAADVELGEAHYPETHLIPRIVIPLINAPSDIQDTLGLGQGFKIYGDDHPTRDGTAVRDYLHVLDLAEAHIRALNYLLHGGDSDIFNLGSGSGYSVKEIVQASRRVLERPDFSPVVIARRVGDPAMLVACSEKAHRVLGWYPKRDVAEMIRSAADWHRSEAFQHYVRIKSGAQGVTQECMLSR